MSGSWHLRLYSVYKSSLTFLGSFLRASLRSFSANSSEKSLLAFLFLLMNVKNLSDPEKTAVKRIRDKYMAGKEKM